MKEYAGWMSKVKLDGPDGCAVVTVSCKVPVADARRLSGLMIAEGAPIRVHFPEGTLPISKGSDE